MKNRKGPEKEEKVKVETGNGVMTVFFPGVPGTRGHVKDEKEVAHQMTEDETAEAMVRFLGIDD